MNIKRSVQAVHGSITFPLELLGWLWYVFIRTPFFRGTVQGYKDMRALEKKDVDEDKKSN